MNVSNDKSSPILILGVLILVIVASIIFIKNTKKDSNEISSNTLNSNIDEKNNDSQNIVVDSNENRLSNSNKNSNSIHSSNSNDNKIKKTFTAKFVINGADTIASTKESCSTTGSSCKIYVPSALKKGYTVLGYSTNKNDTKAQVKEGTYININKNITYYVITRKDIVATFIKTKADDSKTITKKCYIYNNGKSCKITIPRYYKSGSYDNTWSTNKEKQVRPFYMSDSVVSLSNNTTFYATYHHPSYLPPQANWREDRNVEIAKVYYAGDLRFEYEKGIPVEQINKHIAFVKKVYKLYPWYFHKGKVFVLKNETYAKISEAYGLTSHSYGWGVIDIQFDGSTISENATLHEMGHFFDGYYAYATGKEDFQVNYLYNQPDIVNAYNNVHNSGVENLSKTEWLAALITDWFWHYKHLNDLQQYYTGYERYTAAQKKEVMNVINKYMMKAANGYK